MSSQYAEPLDPGIYLNNQEFTSLFRPQIHKRTEVADHAAVQCQLDLFGEDGIGSVCGSMNPNSGNFITLCTPNCLIERLPILAYLLEYAFFHDDDQDDHSTGLSSLKDKALHQELTQSDIVSALTDKERRKSEVIAKIAAELIRLDPTFGNWYISNWLKFTNINEGIRGVVFSTLDDYVSLRVKDVGAVYTLSLLAWGSGIHLTSEEGRISGPMSYAASLVLLFTNDLFSWDKEYRAYIESKGSVHLTNSVHVVMSSHNVDQNAAKEIVRAEIREQEERFSQLSDQYKANSRPSESVLKWLDLLETTMAGNSIWSIRCPRYSKIERNPYLGHLRTFRSNTVRVIRSTADVFDSGTTIKTGNLINSDHGNTTIKEEALVNSSTVTTLDDEPVLDPYTYINSLPSKNVRKTLISALNLWFKVPTPSLETIEGVINLLHNASLLLDDIQDTSSVRRGKPVAQHIFGIGQTVNSATYQINEALRLVQRLSTSAISIYSEEMRNLHLGQAHDLRWSYHTQIPTLEQYITMVDGKTGGLFRLITRLMKSEATTNKDLDLNHFATLLGRHFQIRDDYQNLSSVEYTQQKGYCEDFDGGKISFPIILATQSPGFSKTIFSSIFRNYHQHGSLSLELKQLLLEQIAGQGAFSQTRFILSKLHQELLRSLAIVEREAGGIENWRLRLMIMKLDITDGQTKKDENTGGSWREVKQKSSEDDFPEIMTKFWPPVEAA